MGVRSYQLTENDIISIEQIDRSTDYVVRMNGQTVVDAERYQLENGVSFTYHEEDYEIHGLYFIFIPQYVIYKNGQHVAGTHHPAAVTWFFTVIGILISALLLASSAYTVFNAPARVLNSPTSVFNSEIFPAFHKIAYFGILIGLLVGFETKSWIVKSENSFRTKLTVALTFLYWLWAKQVSHNMDWLNNTYVSGISIMNYCLQAAFIFICLSILFFDAAKCIRNHCQRQIAVKPP